VLLLGYTTGVRSSRKLEEACYLIRLEQPERLVHRPPLDQRQIHRVHREQPVIT